MEISTLALISAVPLFWIACLITLFIWKKELLNATWQEPYFKETPVLIESDDWGPGGEFHAERLATLLNHLKQHKDSIGRTAILTADIVLAVPDIAAITEGKPPQYKRKFLDEAFPEIYQAMKKGISDGILVPQLHGLEHLNGNAFHRLFEQSDSRVEKAFQDPNWWDWESLDSPLQGHYVDGSQLPSQSLRKEEIENTVDIATTHFKKIFGHQSTSTVAPCYLWDDQVETAWSNQGIKQIQTAGYRCTSRNKNGDHTQNPQLIRVGNKSHAKQIYLVRNVMYEPVDGTHSPNSAFLEVRQAHQQALPITISTHRYNYTRSEVQFNSSLAGLDKILKNITQVFPNVRFLSSPELGDAITNKSEPITNQFNQNSWPPLTRLAGATKIAAFLQRLRYRHPKLTLIAKISGLIIPVTIIIYIGRRKPQNISSIEL